MSFQAVAWAYSWGGELTSPEKFVLVTIAHHFNQTSLIAFPSIASLARSTELDERTVQRALRRLVAVDLIRVVPRFTASGRQTSNGYYIPDLGVPPGVSSDAPEGDGEPGEGGEVPPPGVAEVHPNSK